MTDFRALCVELTDCLEKADWPNQYKIVFQQWIDIAHAALAEQPVIFLKQRVFPTPSQAAECGGPCYEGNYCPEACDCGLYQPPLSLAAAAVLDAVTPYPIHEAAIAAALRAAADQASYCLDGSNYYVAAKDDLLAIANELEQLDA